jgi:hypothetical protein
MTLRTSIVGFVSAVLVAAVVAAPVPKGKEDFGPVTDEQLQQAANNLKQIGIALHAYHDTYGQLPANITAKNGEPLLSWRVAILPFIEEDALYKQFKLDEVWDGEHNMKLVEQLPKVYAPVRVKTKEKSLTFLQGFDGPDATFEAGKKLRIPASFPDGTSNTLAVAEAGEPVVWSKPADLPFDPKKDLPKLGGQFEGDFHAVCMDGATYKVVGKKIDHAEFKKMVTKADGYPVNREAAFGEK